MLKYISIPIVLVCICIGLLYVYLVKPDQTYIYVYPTPDNVNLIQYKDKVNNCYEFDSVETICPENDNFEQIPVQN